MGAIYKIYCEANNTAYVGSAKDQRRRWGEHLSLLRKGRHFNNHLQAAWLKYGEQAFSFDVLEEIEVFEKEFFYDRENHWMNILSGDVKLFNQCKAGSGWNSKTFDRLESISEKISKSTKRFAESLTADERKQKWGHRRGIPLSDEHRKKTSEGLKGKLKSTETKRKMSIAQKRDDPKRQITMSETGKKNRGRTPANAIIYEIDGSVYPSGGAAMQALDITSRQLHRMVQNGTAKRKEKN